MIDSSKCFLSLSAVALLSLINIKSSSAENFQFIASDNSNITKLCFSAVTNNLIATKKYINRMNSFGSGSSTKAKMAINSVSCNHLDLVQFTSKYGAHDTFNYLNRTASMKYKMSNEEIRINDLARNSLSNPIKTTVVLITSR